MDRQRTIVKEVSIDGIGLHTGNPVNITFKPADVDSGINFMRIDLPSRPVIKASIENILPQTRSPRRTSLGSGDIEIHTIEHLMAALAGLDIDNLYIEMDNDEVPGLDGSSVNFLDVIACAGLKEQTKARKFYQVKDPIFAEEEGASILALPSQDFRISYTLSYNHPLLKAQHMEVNVNPDMFKRELASARTFCLEDEAEDLQRQGMGRGADYNNTLVVGKTGVIKNKLRYEDEFIRHKILDLLGDLYLIGQPIKAHVVALRSGHSLNLKLTHKINQQRQRYALSGIGIDYRPQEGEKLDTEGIMKVLPHRPPFLFVDRIISLERGKRAIGVKKLSVDEYFFKGHFPGKPVMPGVLILEAMAQVGGVMMLSLEENRGRLAYFMAADNIKFRKTVLPGDELTLVVEAGKVKSKTGQLHAKGLVNGKVVAEADFMFAFVEA